MTRKEIEKRFVAVNNAYGLPMYVGLHLFKAYIDAILEYIDGRTK